MTNSTDTEKVTIVNCFINKIFIIMKKFFFMLLAVVAFSTAVNAQSNLGLRFGAGYGYGAELSYQMPVGGNRLELDLGFASNEWNYINLNGVYQWTWNIAGNFGWYAGVGANLGIFSNSNHDGFGLGVAGQIGLEYNFNIPLQITLDFRPTWNIIGYEGFGWGGANLGLRYRF